MTKEYIIADFRLRITGGEWLPSAGQFARTLHVFEVSPDDRAGRLFTLHTDRGRLPSESEATEVDCFDFQEVGAVCRLARTKQGWLFTMQRETARDVGFFLPFEGGEAWSDIALGIPDTDTPSLFRFGLWMIFGLAVNPHHAIPIHSSTIRYKNNGVLFLGESGTGKSTHTGLWLKHIPGAVLLNDDSPIIRIREGVPTVYGSPWSGKSPVYKQENYPIRALVRLSQAPANTIRKLSVVSAIGALLPSCPPSFAFDDELQDHECDTLSQMIARVPVFHLACLPDQDAARLSHDTIFGA